MNHLCKSFPKFTFLYLSTKAVILSKAEVEA